MSEHNKILCKKEKANRHPYRETIKYCISLFGYLGQTGYRGTLTIVNMPNKKNGNGLLEAKVHPR